MPRGRDPGSLRVVHRTTRAGVRVTRGQRRRLVALLVSAGDVWAAALELNGWRRARQDRPLVGYQELCQELAVSGPGTFGELDSQGTRSVLRRYSDAWFAAAQRRHGGDQRARFPRRRRALVPPRWYHGTFTLAVRRLRIPVARGCPALWMRLDRDLPYPPDQVRSVTLLYDAGRLWVDVTAEVPVACYPAGHEPDPSRVAGLDLGIIHPYAVAGPGGDGLLVSGRRSEPSTGCTGRPQGPCPGGGPPCPQTGAERLAAVAALPAPPARGGGAAPAAGPPGSARGCQSGHHLGR
jgi:hypothetical protein